MTSARLVTRALARRRRGGGPDRPGATSDYGGRVTSYTVPGPGTTETEMIAKRSRFLCAVRRVESEQEARAFVDERRRVFHDARHTCSAFVIGPDRGIARSSDDGEPAGTAGMPMLEALTKYHSAPDISDAVAVVTRWFGGILLGAGGLTRAYSEAVTNTLAAARLVRRSLLHEYGLELPYATAGHDEAVLRGTGVAVVGVDHGATGVRLNLAIPDSPAELDALTALVAQITGGGGRLTDMGTRWADAHV